MTTDKFIEFIKELGFQQTWGIDSKSFTLSTDNFSKPNNNMMPFADQLKVSIIDEYDDLVQLSLSQMSSHMMSGKSFGSFNLKTFGDNGDFQQQLFISFILGSFNNPPNQILQYMRDKKIKNILQQ